MKFGVYLKEEIDPRLADQYLNYDLLKNLIKELEELEFGISDDSINARSLTLPRPTNAAAQPIQSSRESNQEKFFATLEQEMKKIEKFTLMKVNEIRALIVDVERRIPVGKAEHHEKLLEELRLQLEKAGEEFLK